MQTSPRPRGRPRRVVEQDVLAAITGVFWERGFAGASLGDLAEAAGVSRPSLYETIGDKRAMYLAAVDAATAAVTADMRATLAGTAPLDAELAAFFDKAIALYCGGGVPRGCLVTCTAPAEAVAEPMVREALAKVIAALDAGFGARFRLAAGRELPAGIKPDALGRLATGLLQSLALRARSGATAASLTRLAAQGVAQLCR